jgi:sulfite reductase (NADPH) flavoprotein alpha-component
MSRSVAVLGESLPSPEALRSSPLGPALEDEARRLIAKLDAGQRLWLSGYLAGLGAAASAAAPGPAPVPVTPLVTVLYGSQTGNAERLARDLAAALEGRGVPCLLLDMIDCGRAELIAARMLVAVVSTQGEGDPPDRALGFWELLNGRKAPQLPNLQYAVLGLGDSSYAKFCETGKQLDARFEALGARRLHARADCDVDFEESAKAWLDAVMLKVAAGEPAAAPAPSVQLVEPGGQVAKAHTRKNPFLAEVLVNQRLTMRSSTKDVRHVELSLEGSGIRYEPGDALGVVPRNAAGHVAELLEALPYDPDALVVLDPQAVPLREALEARRDIAGRIDRDFLERYASAVGNGALRERLERDAARLDGLLADAELIDVVREFPPENGDATAFALALRPLAQRLYSIASSPHAAPDEAHLTVAVAEHRVRERARRGVVSGALADLAAGERAPIYLHRNAAFRLPAPDVPIVMIGPGTGVAPFRAFVAERSAVGARGRNWLFFGDRRFETDFLYQAEWLAWRKQGILTRIEVAFSRDQAQKIYVQDRMRECGAELWSWLEEGAHVYVCGDAQRMAPDVHAELLRIARRHGGLDAERADEYLTRLQRDRRYQRDVY